VEVEVDDKVEVESIWNIMEMEGK